MDSETRLNTGAGSVGQPVSSGELNAWRRGLTPQAEIWNGRMAMAGLAIGLCILLFTQKFFLN